MNDPFIDPKRALEELRILKDLEWEREEAEYKKASVEAFTVAQRDEIIEIISNSPYSKEEIRERLKKSGVFK